MDDCLATVALDLGGRSWLCWDASFAREKIGDMPTEMFFHFFKSFADAAQCNLNIKVEGENEHHKIESIFKALGRCIRQAVQRDGTTDLPTTKGMLS
jgi:imidazoleglycerol-phosphate dehydratase/histidinol-phosphatase